MGFAKVAEQVATQKWKSVRHGERDGRGREVYFQNKVWERLKRRCDERGISVSRYLQTLALMSLEEDER